MDGRAQETLEMLDSWSSRLEGHCTQKRSGKRSGYRRLINVILPEPEQQTGENEDERVIEVTARNLSRGGVSFLHWQNILADEIIVVLGRSGDQCLYLESQIVRRRQVHNGLWEFGAEFLGKTNIENMEHERLTLLNKGL